MKMKKTKQSKYYIFTYIISFYCIVKITHYLFCFRIDDGKQHYLKDETTFEAAKLAFHKEGDIIILTYNHEKHVYIKSSEFTGDLKCYKSTIPNGGPYVYVKKSKF